MKTCIEVAMFLMLSLYPKTHYPQLKAAHLCKYSHQYSVDPILALAVAKRENRFRHTTWYNRSGDVGFFQLNCRGRKAAWCTHCNPRKLECNIHMGFYLMSYLRDTLCKSVRHHWIRHYNWNSPGHTPYIMCWREELEKMATAFEIAHELRDITLKPEKNRRASRRCVRRAARAIKRARSAR